MAVIELGDAVKRSLP